jgi:hypothetical protein
LGSGRGYAELVHPRSQGTRMEAQDRCGPAFPLDAPFGFRKPVRSSQSRVAKMEAGDHTVSLDLLDRSLPALGVSRKDWAHIISN